MIKQFKYELRRLLVNPFFFGLIVVTALYSYRIMEGDIILGVANTAPFSGWSYGTYMAKLLPILLISLLFFISFFLYSGKERAVQVLTDATSVNTLKFRLLRYGAIVIAFVLITLVPLGYSMWFYGNTFGYTSFGSLFAPALLTLLPALLFVLGLGLLAGLIHPALVFALIPIVLLLGYLPLPIACDLYGFRFFSGYPVSLGTVEPAFTVSAAVWIGKSIYVITGIIMIVIAPVIEQKKRNCSNMRGQRKTYTNLAKGGKCGQSE